MTRRKQSSILVGRYVTDEEIELWTDDRPDNLDIQHMTTNWGMFRGVTISALVAKMATDFEGAMVEQLTEPSVKVRIVERQVSLDAKPEQGCVASGRVDCRLLMLKDGEESQHEATMFWTVVQL